MSWLDRLKAATGAVEEERHTVSTVNDLAAYFGGFQYPLSGYGGQQGPPGVPSESVPADFVGMVQGVYQRSGVVSACISARMHLFSEARLKWRTLSDRKLWGDQGLEPLERPWPTGSTGELLARMEQDASLSGNAYILRDGRNRLRLRPDWVHLILGTNTDYEPADAPDATVVAFAYWPGGIGGKYEPKYYLPSEVGHYAPIPDPGARFRGQSWITPILPQIDTDRQLTAHKAQMLEKGTPAFAIRYPETFGMGADGPEKRSQVIDGFKAQHEGVGNAWNALHLFGGADTAVLGLNFRDLDYKSVQGQGETMICAAARVPAAIVGVSEGLAGSALNAGNFGQARRQFGEQFAYPSWRMACEALSPLVDVPAKSELWYDTHDVAFLHEDAKDAAEVNFIHAQSIRQLIETGMSPDAAVIAVTGGDMTQLLGAHTGLVSVQLQPPGTQPPPPARAEPPVFNIDATTSVAPTEVKVDARSTHAAPEIRVEHASPEVHVDVAPTEVRIDPPPPAEVTVNMPDVGRRTVKKTVQRDDDGNILAIIEDEDG